MEGRFLHSRRENWPDKFHSHCESGSDRCQDFLGVAELLIIRDRDPDSVSLGSRGMAFTGRADS